MDRISAMTICSSHNQVEYKECKNDITFIKIKMHVRRARD